jgi:NADH:ubiquinone oxidoreductase subunit 2 (subunit N)
MGTGQLLIIGFVAFAALNSVFSLAYYMPLVQVVFRREMSLPVRAGRALPQAMTLPIGLLAVAIVAIGLWPNLLRDLTAPAGAALLTMFAAP